MTDLAVYEPPMDLEKFAIEASQVHGVAKALSTTSFVPTAMRGKPDEIAAAILFGREIGLPPMVALQSVHVIEGRPSLSALAMRGKAQAAGVRFRLIEANSTRVKYAALPPGETEWTEVLWTMDRAKQLGLATKSNWLKQPQAMLIARATSELCRLVAANLFLGYPYSSEELRDGKNNFDGPEYDPPPPAHKTTEQPTSSTQRILVTYDPPPPAPKMAAAPETEEWPEEKQPPAPELESSPTIGTETRKALMAAFNEHNIRDRTGRLAHISEVVGREVHSANQLTDTEGKQVIRSLRNPEWPQEAMAGE